MFLAIIQFHVCRNYLALIRKRQLDRSSARRSLRSVYCTGNYEKMRTDDNRMVRGLVTTADAEEFPNLTV